MPARTNIVFHAGNIGPGGWSYSLFDLIETKPHDEQMVIYFTDDQRHEYPLDYSVNQLLKSITIFEDQPNIPNDFHLGKYNHGTDDTIVYRATQIDGSYVTFVDGARLTAATLNLHTEQIMHLLQELTNRLDETVVWELLPHFECLLEVDIQCDVDQNLADIQTLFGNVADLFADVGTEFESWISHTVYDSEGKDLGEEPTVLDLYDHTAVQYQFIDHIRADVNWLLCQSPAYDGDNLDNVTSVFPVNSDGDAWVTGCMFVKLIFEFVSGKIEEIVYAQPPHIIDIETEDGVNDFDVIFKFCDNTTDTITILKLAGPTGDTGAAGVKGAPGKGVWIWGRGTLSELIGMDLPQVYNLRWDQESSICYWITHDEWAITNAWKGDAGHTLQNLTPTFKNPNDRSSGDGDYTGYILRYEKDGSGGWEWQETGIQHALGIIDGPPPLRWTYDLSSTIPEFNGGVEGRFMVDLGGGEDFHDVVQIRFNNIDASGSDVGDLLWALVKPFNRPQNRGVLVMSSERNPSYSASYLITGAEQIPAYDLGGGLEGPWTDLIVTNLHVTATPSSNYEQEFPFYDSGALYDSPDRIYMNIFRAGDNFFDDLDDLGDVDISNPQEKDVLLYSSSGWENGKIDIGDLDNVDTSTNLENNDILIYDSNIPGWTNGENAGGGGGGGDITGVRLTSDDGFAEDLWGLASLSLLGGDAIETEGDGTEITIHHSNTSSQASVDNADNTFIQDIALDAFGHITSITSSEASGGGGEGDITGVKFNTDTSPVEETEGLAEFNLYGGNGMTVVGTGSTLFINHDSTTQDSVDNTGNTFIQDIVLDDRGHITGLTSSTVTGAGSPEGTDVLSALSTDACDDVLE